MKNFTQYFIIFGLCLIIPIAISYAIVAIVILFFMFFAWEPYSISYWPEWMTYWSGGVRFCLFLGVIYGIIGVIAKKREVL